MVMGIFHSLLSQGKTVVMVTHDEDLAGNSQRILRLSDGRIVKDLQNEELPIAKAKRKKWLTWFSRKEKR